MDGAGSFLQVETTCWQPRNYPNRSLWRYWHQEIIPYCNGNGRHPDQRSRVDGDQVLYTARQVVKLLPGNEFTLDLGPQGLFRPVFLNIMQGVCALL